MEWSPQGSAWSSVTRVVSDEGRQSTGEQTQDASDPLTHPPPIHSGISHPRQRQDESLWLADEFPCLHCCAGAADALLWPERPIFLPPHSCAWLGGLQSCFSSPWIQRWIHPSVTPGYTTPLGQAETSSSGQSPPQQHNHPVHPSQLQ